jgi:drug/metabolite transporter (DMT)-like permease
VTQNLRNILLLLAAMAAFVANDTCMKVLSQSLPLFETILLRGIPTTLVLFLMMRARGASLHGLLSRDKATLGLRCLGEVLATLSFLAALRHMPIANLSAIMQSLPLAVTLAAALLLGDAIGPRRLAAILVGFVGVLIIVRPGTDGFDSWSLLGLVSVAFVVLRDLTTRMINPAIPSVSVAVLASVSVTVTAAILTPLDSWVVPNAHDLALILLASAFLIVGYLTVVMAQRTGEFSVIAPFRYSALVFAMAAGWLVFGEWPDGMTMIGSGIVIATGVYMFRREALLRSAADGPAQLPAAPAFTSDRR